MSVSRKVFWRNYASASDGERLVLVDLEPFLDVEIEAGEPVVFVCHRAIGPSFLVRILDFSVMQNTDRDAAGK